MIVARETQDAAVFRRTRRVAVAEHVTATIHARTLAVPDARNAIELCAGRQIELLRSPHRRRGKIFVHAGLKFDVVLFEMFAGCE